MARDYAKHSPVSPINNSALVTVAILLFIQGAWSQRVKVVPEVEAYPAGSVVLRCQFADGGTATKLTQVSWIWEPEEGERDNIAVFHPTYGESFPDSPFKGRTVFVAGGSLESPSIRISQLTMKDAGRYTCEYATYPSGNEQGTTTLIMLAKPKNSAQAVTVPAGNKPMVVATCEAADGKPAAEIKWMSTADGVHNTTSVAGADGTVTVRSEYRLVPAAALNGREVACIVSQRTQDKPQSFSLKLSVEYPPTVTIDGYDDNWYVGRSDVILTCNANANPAPTIITWKSMSGPMPDTVEIEGNQLRVRRVDDAVNTTFVCEVRNRLGVSKQQLTTTVIEKQKPAVGSSTGGIIAGVIITILIVAAVVAVVLFLRKRKRDAENGDGPPKHKPPPPAGKHGSSTEMLNKPDEPPASTETEPLSHMYYDTTTSGEPVTDLDAEDTPLPAPPAANGGAPTGPEDSLQYDHEVADSVTETLPPYSDPADGRYDDAEPTPEPPTAATVARGESFVSEALFV